MDADKEINHAGGEESNANSQAEDKKGDGQDVPRFQNTKRERRGKKPRSERNRKRQRSQAHSIENQSYETKVSRLELDGEAVHKSTGWLRTVEPYPYTFSTFAKLRWLGRTVLDVYCTEFGSYPKVRTCSDILARMSAVLLVLSNSNFFWSELLRKWNFSGPNPSLRPKGRHGLLDQRRRCIDAYSSSA